MKKILLISGKQKVSSIKSLHIKKWPPLELVYTFRLLQDAGFDVTLLDLNYRKIHDDEVIERSKESDFTFLSTASLDRWQCPTFDVDHLIEIGKKLTNLYYIGPHASINPKKFLNETNCKGIIVGEPELAILNICKGKHKSKKIIVEKAVNLDLLIPEYTLLTKKEYFYELLGSNFTILELSRGCPFNCAFCFKKMYKGYRTRSIKKALEQISTVVKRHKIKNIYFIDLEFIINENFTKNLCKEIIKQQIDFNWACQTRLDSLNLKLLELMQKAGCKVIHTGIETGSRSGQSILKHKVVPKRDKKTIEHARNLGIMIVGFFIIGFDKDIKNEYKATLKLANYLDPDLASFHALIPYPETKAAGKLGWNIFDDKKQASAYFSKLRKYEKKLLISFYMKVSRLFRIIRSPSNLWKRFKIFLNYYI